jgi:hypothetical protein
MNAAVYRVTQVVEDNLCASLVIEENVLPTQVSASAGDDHHLVISTEF